MRDSPIVSSQLRILPPYPHPHHHCCPGATPPLPLPPLHTPPTPLPSLSLSALLGRHDARCLSASSSPPTAETIDKTKVYRITKNFCNKKTFTDFMDFRVLRSFFAKFSAALVSRACQPFFCEIFWEMLLRDVSRKFFVTKVFSYTVFDFT